MGNSESSNPIRNMDKRTARREYRTDFSNAITRYRQRTGYILEVNKPAKTSLTDLNSGVRVYVRKRPIFQHEIDNGEFDVITCMSNLNKVIVHDARMHNDMKRQLMNHHEFEFDSVFNEKATNSFVYQNTAKSLVEIACEGGYSTALVYGQTGSGKTFTMSSIYSQAATDIFAYLDANIQRFSSLPTIALSFIEIAGDQVADLLNGFRPTSLKTASDGTVHAYPVVEPVVTSSEELLAIIQHGLNIRTTAATGVHDASSRSHALLRIYIQRHDLPPISSVIPGSMNSIPVEGVLTLVDLAGSEHRIDSMYHGKERRKETSYINASLMALKECIRSRANGDVNTHIFRKSKLTMALKNSFTLPKADTIVIAAISPASKDTEHSLNTLRHACIMHGQQDKEQSEERETRFVTGGTVTTEQIGEVNLTNLARKNQIMKKQSGSIEGLKSSNGNTLDNKAARQANQEAELTEKAKNKMRRLSEQKSFSQLEASIKEILKLHRGKLGNEQRQLSRFQFSSDDRREASLKKEMDLASEIEDEVDHFHSSLKLGEDDDDNNSFPPQEVDEEYDHGSNTPPHYEAQDVDERRKATSARQSLSQVSHSRPTSGSSVSSSNRRASLGVASHAQRRSERDTKVETDREWRKIPYESIYQSIFIAKDSVPVEILLKQLGAMLQLHGYSAQEIASLISAEEAQLGVSKTKQSISPRPLPGTSLSTVYRSNSSALPEPANQLSNPQSHPRPSSASRNRPTSANKEKSPSSTLIRANIVQKADKKPSPAHDQQLSLAKQKLEEEAKARKARQEAAKQFRDEQERIKTEKIQQKRSITPVKKVASSMNPRASPDEDGHMEGALVEEDENNNREFHLAEIQKLSAILEDDQVARPDDKLSMAKKFGVKRQLALHKAAILKLQRAKSTSVGVEFSMALEPKDPVKDKDYEENIRSMEVSGSRYGDERSYAKSSFNRGEVIEPSLSEEAQSDYAISELGRPLNTRMAENLRKIKQQSKSKIIGYHIEERSSVESDAFSKLINQPVGIRSDSHEYPPVARHNKDFGTEEEFVSAKHSNSSSRSRNGPVRDFQF